MAEKTFEEISKNISYSQESFPSQPHFTLMANSPVLFNLNDIDDTNILFYINANNEFVDIEQFRKSFSKKTADQAFGEFVSEVASAVNAPVNYITDLIDNQNQASVDVYPIKSQNSTFFAFSKPQEVGIKVLDNCIGNDLEWCKILYKDVVTQTDTAGQTTTKDVIRPAFCLRKNIKRSNFAISNKILIEPADIPISGIDRLDQALKTKYFPKNINSGAVPLIGQINKVSFDDNIAAYVVTVEVDIISFQNVPETEKIQKITNAFKKAVNLITENDNKNEINSDAYYCFGKIENILISARPSQKPLLLVSVPYRILQATGLAKTPITVSELINLPANINDAIESIGTFDTTKYVQNIANALNGPAPGIGATYDAFDSEMFGGGPNSIYISLSDIQRLTGVPTPDGGIVKRTVPIKVSDLKNTFTKVNNVLNSYDRILRKEINDDTKGAEAFIEISIYQLTFINFSVALTNLLNQNQINLSDDKLFLYIQFAGLNVVDIFLTSKESDAQKLVGAQDLINNDPLTDPTFVFFLTNINELSQEKTDGSGNISDFLSKYVAPADKAVIKYANQSAAKNQRASQCLSDYGANLKNQAKARTNEALNAVISKESIDNFKKSLPGSGEYDDIGKQFDQINKDNGLVPSSEKEGPNGLLFQLKTIQWELVIDEATKCIQDAQTRDIVRRLLLALLQYTKEDVPIRCLLPTYNLPRFPTVRLPQLPNIASLVTQYYANLAVATKKAKTQALIGIVRAIIRTIDYCQGNTNPQNIGADPDALTDNPASSNQALTASDEDRQKQYQNVGIISSLDTNPSVSYAEIRLILSEVASILTQEELTTLYVSAPSTIVLNLVKNKINLLEIDGKISKIPATLGSKKATENGKEYTLLSDAATIQFFGRFEKILNANAYNKFINPEQLLSTDLLCYDDGQLAREIKNSLIKKGLSEQDAVQEVLRRQDSTQKLMAELAISLKQLSVASIKLPPFDCVTNPDGTVTPGLTDQLGVPQALTTMRDNLVDGLFKQSLDSYQEEMSVWFQNASEYSFTTENGKYTISNIFFKNTKNFLENSPNKIGTVILIDNKNYVDEQNNNTVARPMNVPDRAPTNNSSPLARPRPNLQDTTPKYVKTLQFDSYFEKSQYFNFLENEYSKEINLSCFSNDVKNTSKITIFENDNFFINNFFDNNFEVKSSTGFDLVDSLLSNNKTYSTENYSASYSINDLVLKKAISDLYNPANESVFKKYLNKSLDTFFYDPFVQSFLFEEKNPPERNNVSKRTSNALRLNLNPKRTKKDIACKKPDLRLISIIDDIKQQIKNAAASSACVKPKLDANGIKIEATPSDIAMFEGCINMLLRVYAIDYNLKLLPINYYATILDSKTLKNSLYEIFCKDIKNNLGIDFLNKLFNILLKKYLNDIKSQIPVQNVLNDEILRKEAFLFYFNDNHFRQVSQKIYNLYISDINAKVVDKNSDISFEQKIINEKKYPNFLEFLFDNIWVNYTGVKSPITLQKNVIDSLKREKTGYIEDAIRSFVTDEQSIENARVALTIGLTKVNYSAYISDVFPQTIIEGGKYEFGANIDIGFNQNNQNIQVEIESKKFVGFDQNTRTQREFDQQQEITGDGNSLYFTNFNLNENSVIENFKNIVTTQPDNITVWYREKLENELVSKYSFDLELFRIFASQIKLFSYSKWGEVLEEQKLFRKFSKNIKSTITDQSYLVYFGDENWKSLPEAIVKYETLENINKKVQEYNTLIEREEKRLKDLEQTYINSIFRFEISKEKNKIYFILNTGLNTDINVTPAREQLIGTDFYGINIGGFSLKGTVLYETAYRENYNYKNDSAFKQLFFNFFTTYIPLEELLGTQTAAYLQSINSVQRINLGLRNTKSEIKKVFDIVEAAGDHTKVIVDNGLAAFFAKVKVLLETGKFMVKNVAAVSDPNIAVASAISTAYKSGVAAAESLGVSIPVKNLPIWSTSLPLPIPILTPQGYAAFGLSLEESFFEDDIDILSTNDKC